MYDPLLVSMGQSQCGLGGVVDHLRGRDRALLQPLAKAVACYVLHHNVEDPLDLVGVEGADHVRVIKPTRPASLRWNSETTRSLDEISGEMILSATTRSIMT